MRGGEIVVKNLLPEDRLEQAYELYLKKDYKASLEHYEWFYDNAEKIDSSYSGAKYRSLKEWHCLANKYPPAFDALVKRKNNAYRLFQEKNDINILISYMRICHALKHDEEAIKLFIHLHEVDTSLTKKVYKSIESILIKNRKWKLCSSCIDNSMEHYKMLLSIFDELIRISESGSNGEYNKNYEEKFEKDVQNLIWILKSENREEEISKILEELKIDLNTRNIILK